MANQWKIAQPSLTELVDGISLQQEAEEAVFENDDLRCRRYTDQTLDRLEGQTLDVNGCVFERCTFGEMDLKRLSFVDCVFDKCEWSNARLTNAAFQRVRFQNCRLTGMELLRGVLMNVCFDGCMMDYLSVSETKLERTTFENCRLRESLWADVKLGKSRIQNTDLTRAQWMRTPLLGVDMSTCQIDGWNISLYDLRGVKLTSAQVISLSGLLGVEVVD